MKVVLAILVAYALAYLALVSNLTPWRLVTKEELQQLNDRIDGLENGRGATSTRIQEFERASQARATERIENPNTRPGAAGARSRGGQDASAPRRPFFEDPNYRTTLDPNQPAQGNRQP